MPQFSPGAAKTATAPITAKPAGMNCEAELFLGPDDVTKVASSGRVPFVSTGAAKNVNLPITMPVAQGTYHGYIDVFAEGLRFLAYKTTEDVAILTPVPPVAPFQFSSVSALRVVYTDAPAWATIVFHCTITNPNAQSATERIHVFINNWNKYYAKWSGPMELGYFDLTLLPGESVVFTWDGNLANLQYGTGPMLSINTTCHMWLQDDLGNKSSEGVA